MTNHDDDRRASSQRPSLGTPSRRSTAPRSSSPGADLDQLRTKAADAASALYQEGRDLLANSEELAKAKDQLSELDPQESARRCRHRVHRGPPPRAADPRIAAMINEIVAFAQAQAKTAARRAAVPAAFALVGRRVRPLRRRRTVRRAVLLVGAGARADRRLADLRGGRDRSGARRVSLPLTFRRRPPPPPPSEATLPQFVLLAAKSAPSLTPRQLMLTAAVLGVALVLSARRDAK